MTSIQQQNPVYNNPQCPIVQPIPVWPPPELVGWRKLKRKAPCYDTMDGGHVAGKKGKADESSEDEVGRSSLSYIVPFFLAPTSAFFFGSQSLNIVYFQEYRPSSTSKRTVKRVRWKSVDDIAPAPVFKSMTPVTVDTQNRPFISLPIKGSVDKSLYRAISVPHLSPSPSDDEDMAPHLGRGMRRRKLAIKLSLSLDRGECRPSTKTPRPSGPAEKTCHQCRNSKTSPQPPKMKCSALRSNGQLCSFVYCVGCIINRYVYFFHVPSVMLFSRKIDLFFFFQV